MENTENILHKIMDWVIAGQPRSTIIEMIRDQFPIEVSKSHADELINRAKRLMEETVTVDHEQVIKSHLAVYEEIFSYANSVGETALANKALKSKERLLSLVQNSKVTVNNKKTININRDISYDLNKLTPEEQAEFKSLLNIGYGINPQSTETDQIS